MFKRIILALFVLIACQLPDDPPPASAGNFTAAGKMIFTYKNTAPSCSASYGSELATANNATDVGGTETDSTTGWTQQSTLTTWDSIDTAPSDGTYHLVAVPDAANEGFYRQLSGTTPGQIYRLQYDSRHTGSGGNFVCSFAWNNFGPTWTLNTLTSANTTYATTTAYYYYAAVLQYILCRSASTDGGMYLDKFSVKAATLCLGPELFTDANAASLSNEANSVGSFSAYGGATLAAVTTDPQNGTYHLRIFANGNNGVGAVIDLNSILTAGKKYFISWKQKTAAGDNSNCGFSGSAITFPSTGVMFTTSSSWTNPGVSFTYSAASFRYWGCKENGANNNADLYVDSISIKEITGE